MIYAASTVQREDWLPAVRERLAHFHAFELACSEPRIPAGPAELRQLLALRRRHQLVYSLHAPFRTLDIGSRSTSLRRRSERLYAQALEAAARVEARVCVMHPAQIDPPSYAGLDPAGRRALRAAEADAFVRLARRAERLGVRMAVENMPRWRVSRDALWLEELRSAVGSPWLGFTVDVGHAHTSGISPALLLRALGPAVYHVHLHDNSGAGDHHRAVGDGSIDWRAVAEALAAMDYQGILADESLGLEAQLRGREQFLYLFDRAGRIRVLSPGEPPRLPLSSDRFGKPGTQSEVPA